MRLLLVCAGAIVATLFGVQAPAVAARPGVAAGTQASKIAVPATSDIFAAGLAAPPALDGGGGTLPPSTPVSPGATVSLAVAGSGSCAPGGVLVPPDGGQECQGATSLDGLGSISGITGLDGTMFVVGVFTADDPSTTPQPARQDFTGATDFPRLTPDLNQVFFIGDGHDAAGTPQQFVAPDGATKLYLGIADGYNFTGGPGYYDDNAGSYDVSLSVCGAGATSDVAMGIASLIRVHGCLSARADGTFESSTSVRVNGVDVTPNDGKTVVVDRAHARVISGGGQVSVGAVPLFRGPLDLDLSASSVGFGVNVSNARVFGLPVKGATVSASVTGAGAFTLAAQVALPPKFGSVIGGVTLSTDNTRGLRVDQVHIAASNFKVGGKLQVKSLVLTYTAAGNTWQGSADVILPFRRGVELTANATVKNGDVSAFGASVDSLNVPLGDSGVFLQRIGFHVSYDPTAVTGSTALTLGPQVLGKSAARLDGSLTATFGSGVDVHATGALAVVGAKLANGYVDYLSSGRVTFGGDLGFSRAGFTVSGSVSGWATSTAFQLNGSGTVAAGSINQSGNVVLSEQGIAGCVSLSLFGQHYSVGAGYRWGDPKPSIMARSCDLGGYVSGQAVHPSAPLQAETAAATNAPASITLPAGVPLVDFAIKGDVGVPDVTVTGPDGKKVRTNVTGPVGNRFYVVADDSSSTMHVLVAKPAAGSWTFVVNRGPAVTSIETADGLADPTATASVRRTKNTATLSWHVATQPGQLVTFVERGADALTDIVTTADADGSVTFTPTDGSAGTRDILARVTQDGLTRQTTVVTSYSAPAVSTLVVRSDSTRGGQGSVTMSRPGTTCIDVCRYPLATGATTTLTAQADPDSRFLGWTGGSCSTGRTCAVRVDTGVEVSALFGPRIGLPRPALIVSERWPLASTVGVSVDASDDGDTRYDIAYRTRTPDRVTPSAATPWLTGVGPSGGSFAVSPGSTVCFTAVAHDSVGNASPPSQQACSTMPVDDALLIASGTWTAVPDPHAYQGTRRQSGGDGSTLQTATPVTARSMLLVASTGPGTGTVVIKSGDTTVGQVDLSALDADPRALVRVTLPAGGIAAQTVTLVATGNVTVDGLILDPFV